MNGLGTAFQRRAVALLLLIGAIWIVWSSAIGPVINAVSDHYRAVDTAKHQLAQLRRIALGADEITKRLTEVKSEEFDSLFYRKAPTPAVAAAAIQNEIRQSIEEHGGQIVSAQVRRIADLDRSHRVPVAFTFVGDINTVKKVLHDVDRKTPYLLVDQLSIQQRRQAPGSDAEEGNPRLNVTLEVGGHVQVVEGAARAN